MRRDFIDGRDHIISPIYLSIWPRAGCRVASPACLLLLILCLPQALPWPEGCLDLPLVQKSFGRLIDRPLDRLLFIDDPFVGDPFVGDPFVGDPLVLMVASVDAIGGVSALYSIGVVSKVGCWSRLMIYMQVFFISEWGLHITLFNYLGVWPRAG